MLKDVTGPICRRPTGQTSGFGDCRIFNLGTEAGNQNDMMVSSQRNRRKRSTTGLSYFQRSTWTISVSRSYFPCCSLRERDICLAFSRTQTRIRSLAFGPTIICSNNWLARLAACRAVAWISKTQGARAASFEKVTAPAETVLGSPRCQWKKVPRSLFCRTVDQGS
jgi:hypothetical protein